MPDRQWDVFISHASEDKAALVEPLAKALRDLGAEVWYDEFTLTVGDSLARSIDRGLAQARFGVVVLSPAFFAKDWPEYELRGLLARELGRDKVVLPIWHNVSREEVLQYSPPLADKLALTSAGKSPEELAVRLLEVIRPDIYAEVHRRVAFLDMVRKAPVENVRLSALLPSPIRHEKLSDQLIGRIRLMRAALWGPYTHSMDFWVDGFKRDLHPEPEVAWWERLAACYLEYTKVADVRPEQHKAIFNVLLKLMLRVEKEEMQDELKQLPEGAFEQLFVMAASNYPQVDVSEEFVEKHRREGGGR